MLSPILKKKKSVRFLGPDDTTIDPNGLPTANASPPLQVFHAYSFGTSAWTALQAAPLLLTPKLIVTLCASEPRRMTDLESYLCRTLGLTLLVLAVMTLLLTGVVPLTSNSYNPSSSSTASQDPSSTTGALAGDTDSSRDPYAYPTLTVTTIFHGIMGFYLYTRFQYFGAFAFAAGALFSTALFGIGLWVILFGSDQGRISKSTGADKRTSNFPFENKESAREKRREAKEAAREEKEDKRRSGRKSVLRTKSGS